MRTLIQKKKTNRTKQLILGGILVAVMFVSVLGYAFQGKEDDESKKIIYNRVEFLNQNGFWLLDLGQFQFVFKYNPKEVEKIYDDPAYPSLSYYGTPFLVDLSYISGGLATNNNQKGIFDKYRG